MKAVLHGGAAVRAAAPPTSSHLDVEGAERPAGMFKEPCGSSVLLPVAPGPRRWRQPHCLDLLVTCYSGELEGRKQLNKTRRGDEKRKTSLRTNGRFWWSLEF